MVTVALHLPEDWLQVGWPGERPNPHDVLSKSMFWSRISLTLLSYQLLYEQLLPTNVGFLHPFKAWWREPDEFLIQMGESQRKTGYWCPRWFLRHCQRPTPKHWRWVLGHLHQRQCKRSVWFWSFILFIDVATFAQMMAQLGTPGAGAIEVDFWDLWVMVSISQ